MRVVSFLISVLAHVAIILAAGVSLPSMFEKSDDFVMIPIEILEIGDETNVKAAAEKVAEDVKIQEQEKEDPRYAEAPPPPPPMSEPVAEDAMPEPKKVVKPKAKPEPKNKIRRKSMPRRKPSPPRKNTEKELDYGELQALLDKEPKKKPKPKTLQSDDALDSLDEFLAEEQTNHPRQAIGFGDGLTISEIAALRQEIEKCWRPPTGAANPEELIVEMRIFLNEDGSLKRAPRIEKSGRSSFNGNSFTEAAERAALAAVNKCSPYDFLPIDKYERWKEVTITFDPASMIGY
jgi:outer membrane biosynthesis protein TonB